MNESQEGLVKTKLFYALMGIVITGLVGMFSWGISGNDFWWHVKAGEWMVANRALPSVDIFSWYAKENGIQWVSHEWLSQVLFYLIHNATGDAGILVFSLASAILMALMIMFRNKQAIESNIFLSTIFLIPMIIQMKLMFYGRPHLISFFLLYATLACLYDYRKNESSKSIYIIPFIAILWVNFHAGSSTLVYILCFLFAMSGAWEVCTGKLHGERLAKKQLIGYVAAGFFSITLMFLNPYGLEMLIYPYANMGDSFPQGMISEWMPPDAKDLSDLIVLFLPVMIVVVSLIVTDKKIKATDLLVFLFFVYMFFRSVRFGFVFYIASTFFVFDYFIAVGSRTINPKADTAVFCVLILIFLGINVSNLLGIMQTIQKKEAISVVLDEKFVELVRNDSPKRLFNDYNFGVTLIANGIETFVDARADLYSPYNLRDARSLSLLKQVDDRVESKIFDPEAIINKYDFDAFLISSASPLSVYLRSRPQRFRSLLEDDGTAYFRRIATAD